MFQEGTRRIRLAEDPKILGPRSAPVTVALLASPGMGHLIPLGEFAKLLALRHCFSVTIFSASFGPPSPAHQAYDQPPDAHAETLICLTMARSVPSLRHAMRALMATSRLAALVVDIFGTISFGVAWELGLRPYVFFTSTCTVLSLLLHLSELDQSIKGEFRDLEEPVRFPGWSPSMGGTSQVRCKTGRMKHTAILLDWASSTRKLLGSLSTALQPWNLDLSGG